ncbi:MAG: PhoU domain-containing protein [Phycisphaerae bacterium]
MLWELLKALRKTDPLGQMIAEVGQMLEAGRWMFGKSSEVLMRTARWEDLAADLYARDQQINRTEQRVREEIITHLAMGNQADLCACLVLMSVVKDAERIGDYCKNIFEVGKLFSREYTCPQFAKPLDDVRTSVEPLFQQTAKAFVDADRVLARNIVDSAGSLTRTCDMLIRQFLSMDAEMHADEAVTYVLLARFYKRVAAHLGNIASSVISPVPMIDYRPGVQPANP